MPNATTIRPDTFRTNNFDLLRIFAATQVLCQHSLLHLQLTSGLWWQVFSKFSGVPIFFVLSGFLISASFEKAASLKIYTQNRLLRILPGLWACVLLTAIITICLGYKFFPGGLVWLPLQLVGVIYTPKFLTNFGFHSYNGSLWTIPVELQFYFMLPVMYYISKKLVKTKWFFLGAFVFFAITAGLLLYFFKNNALMGDGEASGITKLIQYSFVQHFFLFLLGVVMYKYNLYTSKFIQGKGLLWLGAYLLFAFFPVLPPVMHYVAVQILLGITAMSCAYTLPALSKKILKVDISYGVYIYHALALNLFVEFGLVGKPVYLLCIIAITYFVAYLSWTFIEKPFIKRKKITLKLAEA